MKRKYTCTVRLFAGVGLAGGMVCAAMYLLRFFAISREIDEFDRKMKEFKRNQAVLHQRTEK